MGEMLSVFANGLLVAIRSFKSSAQNEGKSDLVFPRNFVADLASDRGAAVQLSPKNLLWPFNFPVVRSTFSAWVAVVILFALSGVCNLMSRSFHSEHGERSHCGGALR